MEVQQLAFTAANYCDECQRWSCAQDACSHCGQPIYHRTDNMPTLNSQQDEEDQDDETTSYQSAEEDEEAGDMESLPYHARELLRYSQRCGQLERENAALRREVEELREKRKADEQAEQSHGLVATLKRVCFGKKLPLEL
jgi:hypothetical protein